MSQNIYTKFELAFTFYCSNDIAATISHIRQRSIGDINLAMLSRLIEGLKIFKRYPTLPLSFSHLEHIGAFKDDAYGSLALEGRRRSVIGAIEA